MIYYLGEVVRSQMRGDPPPYIQSGAGREVLFRVDMQRGLRPGRSDRG